MKKTIIMLVILFGAFSHADAAGLKANTLRVGSTGETVKVIQQKLLDLGYSTSKVDGKYGRKTAEAVARFQASQKLKADGLCGEKTLALVLESKVSTDASVTAISNSATKGDGVAKSPITDDMVWARTCSDGKPHIKILSPNGGEVYEAGQKITINWKSCNVPWLHNLKIQTTDSDVLTNSSLIMGAGVYNNSPITNDNNGFHTAELDLPSAQWINDYHMAFGKRFKISISSDGNVAPYNFNVSDLSDDTFTINNKQAVDVCRNILGVQTTVPAGMVVADGNCFTSIDPWTADCANGKPRVQVLTPNGNETYTAGQRIDTKWKTCNIPGGMKALVILNDTVHSMGGDLATDTQNDGYESVVLPTASTWGGMQFGKFYNVRVSFPPFGNYTGIMLSDASDNIFTIKEGGILKPKPVIEISAQ